MKKAMMKQVGLKEIKMIYIFGKQIKVIIY